MAQYSVLIVDDEADIRSVIALALQRAGFDTLEANQGREALALAIDRQPQAMIVDWMMPEMNGVELLRRLRKDERTAEIPVIMLSAKSEVEHKVEGLDAGADDYLAKPFSGKELVARVKALLRRHSANSSDQKLSSGSLSLYLDRHSVEIAGQNVSLGPTEFRLLQFFMSHPQRVYSRSQLLDQVWGGAVHIDERTVDVHIRRIRKALQADQHDQKIQTVHGVGYRFSDKI